MHQDQGRLLVIGVLLRSGRRSDVDRILTRLAEQCGTPIEVGDFDLASLVPDHPATLRYHGSLTTDPHTDGVHWVLTAPSTTSAAGIRAFRSVFPDGDSDRPSLSTAAEWSLVQVGTPSTETTSLSSPHEVCEKPVISTRVHV